MGLGDCCTNIQEGISESRPAQLCLSFAGGIILMTLLLAISGTFVLHTPPRCAACFHLAFALNSQQTLCKSALDRAKQANTVCADHLTKNLSIHGLWPSISQLHPRSGGLADCTDNTEAFEPSLLTDEDRARMKVRWSSAFKVSGSQPVTDLTFWKHEWNRHGTCSQYTVKAYFERALALDEHYPLNRWLAEANITPSNSRLYRAEEFETALGRHLPTTSSFYLQCLRLKSARQVVEVQALYQVVLCIDWTDGVSAIQCPARSANESGCTAGEQFYFVEDYTKL